MQAVIDDEVPVFTLINTFRVSPGNAAALVASLREFTETTASHLTGFVGTSVHVSLDGTRVVNYVQWKNGDCMTQMLALPAARTHIEQMRSLAHSIDPVAYEVKYVAAAK